MSNDTHLANPIIITNEMRQKVLNAISVRIGGDADGTASIDVDHALRTVYPLIYNKALADVAAFFYRSASENAINETGLPLLLVAQSVEQFALTRSTHLKTANDYTALYHNVIGAGSACKGSNYVVYTRGGNMYCREQNDFYANFKESICSQNS